MTKRFVITLITLFLVQGICLAGIFEDRCKRAEELRAQKNWTKAIEMLLSAKKVAGITQAQMDEADRRIRLYRNEMYKSKELRLSETRIVAEAAGAAQRIGVTAGQSWKISQCPQWCLATAESDALLVTVEPNSERQPRSGEIVVAMGKITAMLEVEQAERPMISGNVVIRTVPEKALIRVDDEQATLKNKFTLSEGRHIIRLEKDGYMRRDTVVTIDPSSPSDTTYLFNLTREFATLSVNITSAKGYEFTELPVLEINGNVVDLHPRNLNDFDKDQPIAWYTLYKGDEIPLRYSDDHILKVSADGFRTQTRSISLDREHNHLSLSFELEPFCGTLTLTDEENATGARVFINEQDAGTVPFSGKVLQRGNYTVRLVKPGYRTVEDEFNITINGDQETALRISMFPFSSYYITSEPAYCKVFVDGIPAGTTPVSIPMKEGEHVLTITKDGFFPETRTISTDLSLLSHPVDVTLEKTFPLTVRSAKESYDLIISKGSGKNKKVYYDTLETTATVQLPLSKERYSVKLKRYGKRCMYRGKFRFNDPKKNQLNLLAWTPGVSLLSADWYLMRPPVFSYEDVKTDPANPTTFNYNRIADISVGTIPIVRGLSTSVAKGSLFWEDWGAPRAETDPASPMVVPALTVLFLNGDFRVGGAIFQYMDVNLLASYAWYPDLSGILQFSHMSGHDIFLGLELNSRIPVFNLHLKAGLQAFYGQGNILRPGTGKIDIQKNYTVPVQDFKFVVSAGFTLGTHKTRGQSILRIF
ncbi:MAG: PEGA domain-containing protein [Bacteroidales bacterium]|nr:PEGA domain-containing protein [Bacteroidales bacterium]